MTGPTDDDDDETAAAGFSGEAPTTQLAAVRVREVIDAVRMCSLKMVEGPGAPRDIAVHGDELVIGRGSKVAVSIASEQLSRTHAKLMRSGSGYSVVDLDSRNGVYLNRVKVHSAVLAHGDTVQLGDCVFIYREAT